MSLITPIDFQLRLGLERCKAGTRDEHFDARSAVLDIGKAGIPFSGHLSETSGPFKKRILSAQYPK